MKNCKSCKHWDADKARDKAGRIRADRVAPCLYPVPLLPASFDPLMKNRSTSLRLMAAGYGQNCDTHEYKSKEG